MQKKLLLRYQHPARDHEVDIYTEHTWNRASNAEWASEPINLNLIAYSRKFPTWEIHDCIFEPKFTAYGEQAAAKQVLLSNVDTFKPSWWSLTRCHVKNFCARLICSGSISPNHAWVFWKLVWGALYFVVGWWLTLTQTQQPDSSHKRQAVTILVFKTHISVCI